MANDFYNKSGNPTPNGPGSSSLIRTEFASVEAGFAKLPAMSGNGGKIVQVNAGGTALEANALIDSTELSYLNGATSNIQTQLNTEASTRAANDIAVQNAAASDATTKANAAQAAAIAASTPVAHNTDTGNPHATTKAQVGLGNVDNTSDVSKPVSTATQTALNAKAELASPAFTGVPTAPTAAYGNNTTQLATTAHVRAAVSALPSSLPSLVGASLKTLQVNAGETLVEWATTTASDVTEFSVSGTYNVPTSAKFVMVELWGGGGGGGSGARLAAGGVRTGGGGGGGGGYSFRTFKVSEITSSVLVTIGAGGTGGAANTVDSSSGANGISGGNTTFGAYWTAFGGGAGLQGTNTGTLGGAGAGMITGTNSTITSTGTTQNMGGGPAGTTSSTFGGGSVYGGGGGGGVSTAGISGGGGFSLLGGAGGGSGGGLNALNYVVVGAASGARYPENVSAAMGSYASTAGANGSIDRVGGGGGYPALNLSSSTAEKPSYGNSTFAAICSAASGGSITTSTTGTDNWTQFLTPAVFSNLFWDGGKWVCYSASVVYTTTDFVTYTQKTKPFTSNCQAMIVIGGTYVAVGNAGSISTSTDLVNWTAQTSGTTGSLYSIDHDGTRYVVVGAGGITLTSTNLTSWTLVTVSGTPTFFSVACNGSVYVATSSTTPYAFRSTDSGATWNAVATTLTINAVSHKQVTYAGGQWILIGNSAIYTSSDGNTWAAQTDGTTDAYNGVAYNGSVYVVGDSTANTVAALTSPTGVTWTAANFNAFFQSAGAGGNGAMGAGGGGGGGSTNGQNSGAGGNGGNGFARIYSW